MTVDQCGDPPDLVVAAHQVLMEGAGAHLQGGDGPQGEKHFIGTYLRGLLSDCFHFQPQKVQEVTQPPQEEEPQPKIQVVGLFCSEPHKCQ